VPKTQQTNQPPKKSGSPDTQTESQSDTLPWHVRRSAAPAQKRTPSLYALWVLVTRIPALIFGGIMDIGVYTSPGNLLLGNGNLPERDERKMIFSPFGLGVLDLSVVDLALKKISKDGGGTLVESLLS
jgi:hypothetical protein